MFPESLKMSLVALGYLDNDDLKKRLILLINIDVVILKSSLRNCIGLLSVQTNVSLLINFIRYGMNIVKDADLFSS